MTAVKECNVMKKKGHDIISMLVSQPFFILSDELPANVINDMAENANIRAVAVVDVENNVLGILTRNRFFNGIITKKENATLELNDYLDDSPTLLSTVDPMDVWDKNETDQLKEEIWFSVKNEDKTFGGLFSSIDLLHYLSKISFRDEIFASAVQSRINTNEVLNTVSAFSVASFSLPAKNVGGDLVFQKEMKDGSLLFALFDVSGKGASASLVTGILYGILCLVPGFMKLELLIRKINSVISSTFRNELFVTGIIGMIEPEQNIIHIADMGHSHSYKLPEAKRICAKEVSIPLGVNSKMVPKIVNFEMNTGDSIILVSDGIVEQENENSELYDILRVLDIVIEKTSDDINKCINDIKDDFCKFVGLKSQHDDASVMIVRRN